jgi:hypothetical protein
VLVGTAVECDEREAGHRQFQDLIDRRLPVAASRSWSREVQKALTMCTFFTHSRMGLEEAACGQKLVLLRARPCAQATKILESHASRRSKHLRLRQATWLLREADVRHTVANKRTELWAVGNDEPSNATSTLVDKLSPAWTFVVTSGITDVRRHHILIIVSAVNPRATVD